MRAIRSAGGGGDGVDDDDDGRWRGRAMERALQSRAIREKKKEVQTVGKSEREGATVASQAREARRKEGESGPRSPVLNEARRGRIYCRRDI